MSLISRIFSQQSSLLMLSSSSYYSYFFYSFSFLVQFSLYVTCLAIATQKKSITS
uniref:Uncharacterized protein n=1 Tax=Rhizophora mucronata TaxID=61149 RepID=A0A2P2QJD4_RHIMU